jgi:hypothetical protein
MQNDTNKLEPADLNVSMTFPDGDVSLAAQLTLTCRKTNLVIARIDMTEKDVVNFLARRQVGPVEGKSELLNARGRAMLNRERVLVDVMLPSEVDVFEEGHSMNVYSWSGSAARAYGATDFRIIRRKGGHLLSLVYFIDPADAGGRRYLEVVRKNLAKQVTHYVTAAARQKAQARG